MTCYIAGSHKKFKHIRMTYIFADKADPDHMRRVRERMAQSSSKETIDRLQARVELVNDKMSGESRKRLIMQAFKSNTNTKRLMWLRKEADLVQKATEGISSCKAGCSHCCHINVLVTEPEARVIAKEIGLKSPAEPVSGNTFITADYASEDGMSRLQAEKQTRLINHFGQPCPFLESDRCGIYSFRPMACRQQINMDDDELMCKLVEGESIPVPYLNQQMAQAAQPLLWGEKTRSADIRDWFPKGRQTPSKT